MTDIIGLAYCSKPVGFSFEQVEKILSASHKNNVNAGITGALIYDNKAFLQWLEGSSHNIRTVFKMISRDPRHTDIKLLSVRRLESRLFSEWSMTAAVTQDQTLRGLNLVPNLSLVHFDPFGWSEADAAKFMDALSDYLTRRPAPRSEPMSETISPSRGGKDPVDRLDRYLGRLT